MRQQLAEPRLGLRNDYAMRRYCCLSVCCCQNIQLLVLYESSLHSLADEYNVKGWFIYSSL